MGGSAASLAALAFGDDSSNQNTAEFIGAILALLTARRLGITDLTLSFRGDSVTALTWIEEGQARSDRASNAAVFLTLLVLEWRVLTDETIHIPAEQNTDCDTLSRHPDECTMATLGYAGVPHVYLNSDPVSLEVLRLCDPRTDLTSEEGFRAFWHDTHALLSSL